MLGWALIQVKRTDPLSLYDARGGQVQESFGDSAALRLTLDVHKAL